MADDSLPPDAGVPSPASGPRSSSGAAANPASAGGGGSSVPSHRARRASGGSKGSGRSKVLPVILVVVAVVLVGGVIGLVVGSKKNASTTATTAPTPTTAAVAAAPTCPLTGTPAPGGTVPARPALGVKIGNYSGDRPSAGLNAADLVFEEPVEGSITRLLAVYQCQTASVVGDLRSAREPDVGILSQLSKPLFVHAGGITQVLDLLHAAPLTDLNLLSGSNASLIVRVPGRVAPYSTFVNTASVWATAPADTTPPAPIFQYTTAPPPGSVAGSGGSAHIPFSSNSDVTWTWNPAGGDYLRSYAYGPDKLIDGNQVASTNVVIMTVQTSIGTWVENAEGGKEVYVTATGTGPLVVLRSGVAITGTWSRSSLTQPATLTSSNGQAITLEPGNTWIELAPQGVPVTTTPAAPTPATTTTVP